MQAERGWTRQIPRRQQDELADRYIKALDIRPTNPETLVRNLSGGNQQKVLLARWLLTEPNLLILDEPTRGIDVGAKAQIQKLVAGLSEKGMAVIFISAELEEVLRLSHRIGILRDRRMVAEIVNSEATTVDDIMDIIAAEEPQTSRHEEADQQTAPVAGRRADRAAAGQLAVEPLLLRHHRCGTAISTAPPVDILRRAAPIVLVALGMTLVIATRGIDLSVGAVAAISGSWASMYIISSADRASVGVVLTAVGVALLMALVAGAWNGFLVAVLGIQPIVATLVLMVAGRGLAQVITDEKILYPDNSPAYKLIGGGYLLAVPFSILLAGGIFALTAVLTRKTALGTLIESVGVNPEASRLAGVRARPIIFLAYVFSGFCAGLAGLMLTSNSTSADPNSIGLFIELDAILAVVIGGTSLAGGRFSLAGTLIGAFIIETMDAFVVIAISARSTDVFKACVVIVVCLLQSSRVRAWLLNVLRWGRTPDQTAAGATPAGRGERPAIAVATVHATPAADDRRRAPATPCREGHAHEHITRHPSPARRGPASGSASGSSSTPRSA